MKRLACIPLLCVTLPCAAFTNISLTLPRPKLGVILENLNSNFWMAADTNDLASVSNSLRTAQLNGTNSLNTSLRSALAQTNPTSGTITTALGFTPLTPTESTNAANQAALNATNTLNTSLRAALAQTNVFDGRAFTNIGTVGHPGAGVSSFLTNGALVWFVTNAAPGNTVLANGAICSVTDGTFWVRTNSTWVRK